jgi:hypothetical protein
VVAAPERIESDVDPTFTGMDTGATTWVPEALPSALVVVSAAFAAVAPRAINPPAKRVPSSPLRIMLCIMLFS